MRSLLIVLLLAAPLAADTSPRTRRKSGPVTVGYFWLTDDARAGRGRLTELGAVVRWIDAGTLAASLREIDILYLPSEWAVQATLRDALAAERRAIESFLARGGGLYVAQPNVDLEIDCLPLKFTSQNGYVQGDESAVDEQHPLTEGLDNVEMPYPCDQIKSHAPQFRVLARAGSSKTPALLAATWKGGRILLCPDNDNILEPRAGSVGACHVSARLMGRMLEWLARRPLKRP